VVALKPNRNDFLDLSQEILTRGALLRFRARGSSMRPFIESGDVILIEPLDSTKVRSGDVVFYRRVDGGLTAHRLVKINHSEGSTILTMKGDALDYSDPPVSPEQVLGRVISVEKDGHNVKLDTGISRLLTRTWALTSPMSRWLHPILRKLWRLHSRLSPRVILELRVRKLESMHFYRRIARLSHTCIRAKEADDEYMRRFND